MKIRLPRAWPFERWDRLLAILLGVAALAAFSLTRRHGGGLARAALLEEGVSTCFSRVNRSYIAARLADSGSPVLGRPFVDRTEECFGDLVAYAEAAPSGGWERAHGRVNAVANDVYWFHHALAEPGNPFSRAPDGGPPEALEARFRSVREGADGALAAIDSAQAVHERGSLLWTRATYALLFLLIWPSLHALLAPARPRRPAPAPPAAPPPPAAGSLVADGLAGCLGRLSGRLFASGTRVDVRPGGEGVAVALDGGRLEGCLVLAAEAALGLGARELSVGAERRRGGVCVEVRASGVGGGGGGRRALDGAAFRELRGAVEEAGGRVRLSLSKGGLLAVRLFLDPAPAPSPGTPPPPPPRGPRPPGRGPEKRAERLP